MRARCGLRVHSRRTSSTAGSRRFVPPNRRGRLTTGRLLVGHAVPRGDLEALHRPRRCGVCEVLVNMGSSRTRGTGGGAAGPGGAQGGGGGGGGEPHAYERDAVVLSRGGPRRPRGGALYKATMCHFIGHCRNGDACTYAHSQEELRRYARKACRYGAECTDKLCSRWHPISDDGADGFHLPEHRTTTPETRVSEARGGPPDAVVLATAGWEVAPPPVGFNKSSARDSDAQLVRAHPPHRTRSLSPASSDSSYGTPVGSPWSSPQPNRVLPDEELDWMDTLPKGPVELDIVSPLFFFGRRRRLRRRRASSRRRPRKRSSARWDSMRRRSSGRGSSRLR